MKIGYLIESDADTYLVRNIRAGTCKVYLSFDNALDACKRKGFDKVWFIHKGGFREAINIK